MKGLEERWGLFIKHLDFTDWSEIEKQFNQFKQKIEQSEYIIQNPAYNILYGNELI